MKNIKFRLIFAVTLILITTLIWMNFYPPENQEKEEPYCMRQEHFFKKATCKEGKND